MKPGRKVSVVRLRIYSLAVEGNCQKTICQITGRSKATVSGHIAELLDFKALIEISGADKVKFYKKGPKSNILDETIKNDSSGFSRGGRGGGDDKPRTIAANPELSRQTPNYAELSLAASCQVHSHGVRAKVEKVGDLQWLREAAPLNNGIQQMFGSVKLKDGRTFSVKYQESAKSGESWLYVWVETELTLEQMQGDPSAALMSLAQDAYNHIAKVYGWRFGLMENHKGSKTHYVPNSALTDELSRHLPTGQNITAGEVWTDNSPPREDGLPTVETASKGTAIKLMTSLPELMDRYDDMKVAIQIMHNNQAILISDQQAIRTILDTVVLDHRILMNLLGLSTQPSQPRHESDRAPEPGTGQEVA